MQGRGAEGEGHGEEGRTPRRRRPCDGVAGRISGPRRAFRKDEKFPKPRNMIGLLRDSPVEMEKAGWEAGSRYHLAGDEDVRLLGQQRAQAVKGWLLEKAQVLPSGVRAVLPRRRRRQAAQGQGQPGRFLAALSREDHDG